MDIATEQLSKPISLYNVDDLWGIVLALVCKTAMKSFDGFETKLLMDISDKANRLQQETVSVIETLSLHLRDGDLEQRDAAQFAWA